MQLIRWRTHHHLTLRDLAALTGIKSAATLSRIERGQHWVAPAHADAIYWLTRAMGPEPVTAHDHLEAWRKSHPQISQRLRNAGRASAIAHRTAARSKSNGKGTKRKIQNEGEREIASAAGTGSGWLSRRRRQPRAEVQGG